MKNDQLHFPVVIFFSMMIFLCFQILCSYFFDRNTYSRPRVRSRLYDWDTIAPRSVSLQMNKKNTTLMSQIPEEIQENQIVSVTREAYSRASSLSSMVITLIWSQFSFIPNSNSDATWTRSAWLTKIHISDAIITDLSTREFT